MVTERIGVWWASVTWWAWDREMWGWVARLRRFLDNRWDRFHTYNLGVSGTTTQHVLERFEMEAKVRNPTIVVFSIGLNDSSFAPDGHVVVPVSEFEDNIKKMILLAKKFTDKIFFVGLPPIDETITQPVPRASDVYYDMSKVTQYDTVTKNVCVSLKIPFVDILDVLDTKDLEDGIHPNAQWHEKIYLKVRDFMLANKLL
jgi:lysophospholipase L1-like esterase